MTVPFRRRSVDELASQVGGLSPDILATATTIVDDVRERGESALRCHAERLDGLVPGAPLGVSRAAMRAALDALSPDDRRRLERVAARISSFADAQRAALRSCTVAVPGGTAGHTVSPVERAGCYAPGGRYPLPSSLLMTALTARAAGVGECWVASPRPGPMMLAAAALAGVDGFLAIGGAQAIAALTFGVGGCPACDVLVGPGNAWVTAAKQLVSGRVGIDALAGPSELVVLADDTADPAVVAADLLAQAEHDPMAVPILVSIGEPVAERVVCELAVQVASLPTAETALAALANGGVVIVSDIAQGIAACDQLAPEHLELHVRDPRAAAAAVRHYGALFIGPDAAEVLGDYGAGPNHVLPTGRSARYTGGLSVLSFLRVRTWLSIHDRDAGRELFEDAAWLGRVEGLEAHARAAERRFVR